jgi:hypothetical protein
MPFDLECLDGGQLVFTAERLARIRQDRLCQRSGRGVGFRGGRGGRCLPCINRHGEGRNDDGQTSDALKEHAPLLTPATEPSLNRRKEFVKNVKA